jgi:hypothetical protein
LIARAEVEGTNPLPGTDMSAEGEPYDKSTALWQRCLASDRRQISGDAADAGENQTLTVVNEPLEEIRQGLSGIGNGFRERRHGSEVCSCDLACNRNGICKSRFRPIIAP